MGLLIIALILLPQAKLTVGRVARHCAPRSRPACGPHSSGGAVLIVAATAGRGLRSPATTSTRSGLALTIGLGALSLVLLSGYGGQVWLCQFTFMGLGAWAMTKVGGGEFRPRRAGGHRAVRGRRGDPGPPGAPAARLYMALATLAFAVLMDQLFFTNPSVIPTGR